MPQIVSIPSPPRVSGVPNNLFCTPDVENLLGISEAHMHAGLSIFLEGLGAWHEPVDLGKCQQSVEPY